MIIVRIMSRVNTNYSIKILLPALTLFLVGLIYILKASTFVTAQDTSENWPMFRKDSSHSGFNAEETSLQPPLELKWEADIGFGGASSIVVNNVVYFKAGGQIHAVNATSGNEIWAYAVSAGARTSPAYSEGLVLTGNPCSNCAFEAIDVEDHSQEWFHTFPSGARDPVIESGVAYFGSDDKFVRAVRVDGTILWTSPVLNSGMLTVPAVGNGNVYIGTADSRFYALDASNGSIVWDYSISPSGRVLFPSPSVDGDAVYFGNGWKEIISLDANTGAFKWISPTLEDAIGSSPAVAYGKIFLIVNNGRVYALDKATGDVVWNYKAGANLASANWSSPAIANGVVYVGSTDGKLYALDALNGDLLWSYQTGGPIISSPVVANGMVFVGSKDGKFYAFGPKSPDPFLDLPWDYVNQGVQFSEAALSINSFFDHRYPLFGEEPEEARSKVRIYTGLEYATSSPYESGHNGYDYGRKAGLPDGYPVLAPADGEATYRFDTNGGNTILLDHKNGFFTWYMHLRKDGLIVSPGGDPVNVTQGQHIGLVGNTGKRTTGSHLHVSVIKDINENGVFDDYPSGLVDPFGWLPVPYSNDPWSLSGGAESSYLWTTSLETNTYELSNSGGSFSVGGMELVFPSDPARPALTLRVRELPAFHSDFNLRGVTHSFDILAYDENNNFVTSFSEPFEMRFSYEDYMHSAVSEHSLSIYWFNQVTEKWEKVDTTLDEANNTATANINHLSSYILMGEAIDLEAPITELHLEGQVVEPGVFSTPVELSLSADDGDGLGVEYVYFSKENDIDWELYEEPLVFGEDGTYIVFTHSMDQAENVEAPHSVTFTIDTSIHVVTFESMREDVWRMRDEGHITHDWTARLLTWPIWFAEKAYDQGRMKLVKFFLSQFEKRLELFHPHFVDDQAYTLLSEDLQLLRTSL